MAKLKKNSGIKKSTTSKNAIDIQAKAEQLSRSLVESAQQIWLAGVGAFQRAQNEGSKLFDALVSEGMHIEKSTRKIATGGVDAVRDAVEERVGVVRDRASDTWDKLEKVFEERVQRALNRLGVPSREDLADLVGRVEELNSQLRKLGGSAPTAKSSPVAKKTAVKKLPAATTKPAGKPVIKKTSAKSAKAAVKNVAKKPAVKKKTGLPQATAPQAPTSAN